MIYLMDYFYLNDLCNRSTWRATRPGTGLSWPWSSASISSSSEWDLPEQRGDETTCVQQVPGRLPWSTADETISVQQVRDASVQRVPRRFHAARR